MTQTTTHTDTPTGSLHAGGILMNAIVALLAPMFLAAAEGNIGLARLAARETINDFRTRNHIDLIAVAQIIACGLAAICSLTRSMQDDIPVAMQLRLRGNGIALNRVAEQNRRVLAAPLRDDPIKPNPPVTGYDDTIDPLLSAEAEQILAAESLARLQSLDHAPVHLPAPVQVTAPSPARIGEDQKDPEKRHREKWGMALTHDAAELTASIPNLPAAEQPTAAIRAAMLTRTANELLRVPMTAPSSGWRDQP